MPRIIKYMPRIIKYVYNIPARGIKRRVANGHNGENGADDHRGVVRGARGPRVTALPRAGLAAQMQRK